MNDIEKELAKWQQANTLIEQAMPDNLHDWLIKAGPITPMLQAIFEDWRLDVHSQQDGKLLADEQAALKVSSLHAWVREIFHTGHGKNWVYAKLSVPAQTYQCYRSQLDGLGNKPIGATLLFNNPEVIRSKFSYRIIQATDKDYIHACRALADAPEFWARRSVFIWQNKPLLLTEIFSPNLLRPYHE